MNIFYKQVLAPGIALLALGAGNAEAQVGSGTVYVASEVGTMSNYDFSGIASASPKVITNRANPATAVFSFAGAATATNVAAPGQYIDGYARSYKTGAFLFPVGNGGAYAPVKIASASAANPVDVAYYAVSPNSGVIPNLYSGGNVTAPGAPYSTAVINPALSAVSGNFFWDINGAASTVVTLSWSATNSVSDMITADNQVDSLTLVGWNGASWVVIPSVIDNVANSLFGTAATAIQGSISTQSAIVPNTFSAFSVGKLLASTSLPVTGLTLSSRIEGDAVLLQWFTRTEQNTDHFVVERSADGRQFQKIGTQQSAGSSAARSDYDFRDKTPMTGINYYRVVQVDVDGKSVVSEIVSQQFGSNDFVVYPNPARDYIQVTGLKGKVQLQLFSITGQRLNVIYTEGNNSTTIDLRHLATGTYTLSVTGDHATRVFKVSKL